MRAKWHIIYYETKEGSCPIMDFIESCKSREQAKVLSWFSLLEEQGPHLPRPYADLLKDNIYELRLTLSGNQIRILYFFCYKDFIVITHAFVKKTNQVPKVELKQAQKFQADFMARFNENKLREVIYEEF